MLRVVAQSKFTLQQQGKRWASGLARIVTSNSIGKLKLSSAQQTDLETTKTLLSYSGDTREVIQLLKAPPNASLSTRDYQSAVAAAVRSLNALKCSSIDIHADLPEDSSVSGSDLLQAALLTNDSFHRKTQKDDQPSLASTISLTLNRHLFDDAYTRAICEGAKLTRRLVNERADIASPEGMQQEAQAVADTYGLKLTAIVGEELLANRLNMIHAVGRAARVPPRLVTLEYMGAETADEAPIMLVGKGITFDTGGLNLKPTNFIETMHFDMGGSGAVLGAMQAIASLKLKKNVVALLPLAENAIGKDAYKPMDFLTSYKGLTVSVGNTDAEGRLVLADALTYGEEKYTPAAVVDMATLTGACVVALGPYAAGVFSNHDGMVHDIIEAGRAGNEVLWHLPILPQHVAELKCTFTDVSSTGESRYGGASTAAAFLQKFVQPTTPWTHIDIAGPVDAAKADSYNNKGATGFGVASLVNFVNAFKSYK